MAEVLVNIGANTSQATDAVNELNNALGQTGAEVRNVDASTEALQKSLEKQEAQIKVIDGAVNLLGGSVELAASAFVGLGLASEEQAGQFESAALGAIAFADGAKRTLDGVKSLNEGLKSFGGVAGLARKAQLALNSAVLANPYVLAAAAVAALAAALVIYATRETEAEKATRLALETSKLRLQNLEESETRLLSFARAQGIAAEEVLAFEQASVKARIAEIDRILALEEDAEEYKRLSEEQRKLLDREVELALAAGKIREDARQKGIEDEKKRIKESQDNAKKAAEDKKKQLDTELKDEEKFLADSLKAQQDYTKKLNDEFEQRKADRQAIADFEADLDKEAFQKVLDDLEKRKAAGQEAARTAQETQQALQDARISFLDNTAAAVGALANLFGEGTAAFKAAALAEIAISTATGFINALDIAQKSAKATGPAAAFAFPIFYASQIAAVLGAVAAAKNVLATTPGGGGSIPTSSPRASSPSFAGPGATPLGGGFVETGAPVVTPAEPIRAYVVTGDVVNGIQASGQIQRRRTLGPG